MIMATIKQPVDGGASNVDQVLTKIGITNAERYAPL